MDLSPEAQAQLADLAVNLAKNPQTRRDFTKLVQKVDPTKRFPDVEMEDIRQGINDEFSKRDQEAAAKAVRDRLENQKTQLIQSGRFKQEEIAEVEKTMERYGISDYEAGAKLYSADIKPASPTSEIQGRNWQMPNINKEDIDNPNYYRNKMNNVIADIIQKRAS